MNEMKPEDVMLEGAVVEALELRAPRDIICRHALALLREKDARIMELELTLQGVMWSVDKWLDEADYDANQVKRAITMREKTLRIVEEKDAEIERLTTENGILQKRLDEAETSIELLEDAISDVGDDEVEQLERLMATERAEAIGEFVERTKTALIASGIYPVIVKNTLDRVAKEMKEGKP